MQDAAFVVGEVITFAVSDQIENRTVGQRRRLVENKPPLFDTRSERGHVATLRVSGAPGKRSRCSTLLDGAHQFGGAKNDLVPTVRHEGR